MDIPAISPQASTSRQEVYRQRLGQFGLDSFSFFAFLGVAGAYIGLGLLLIALLLRPGAFWRQLRRDPMSRWFGLFAILLGVSLWLGIAAGTAPAADHWAKVESFLKLWLFVLVAYGLQGDPNRIWRALGLALTGFLLGRLLELDADTWARLMNLRRPGLGFTAIALAEYAAMGLLGILLISPRLWYRFRGSHWSMRAGLLGLLGVLGLILAQVVILSLSRGVWLALILCLAWLTWLHYRSSGGAHRLKWLVLIGTGLVGLALIANWETVGQRLSVESETLATLLASDLDTTGTGSISLRIQLWQYGFDLWLERPWWGWGPGAISQLLQAHPVAAVQRLDDLHNIPVELLVRLGLGGTSVLALVFYSLIRVLNRARRQRALPEDLYLLLYGALLLHLLCGLTNFRMFNSDWQLYWYLFAGAAYSVSCRPGRIAGYGPADTSNNLQQPRSLQLS